MHTRLLLLLALLCPVLATAAGKVYTVDYPASTVPGELEFASTYRIWVPAGVEKVRAVIVHQHGCGAGAGKGAFAAADDLHWQALAKKWDAVLVGPGYHMPEKAQCRRWCDPRNGSEKTFLRALAEIGAQSGHPEMAQAPWCLWGHSGGGFWSSLMLTLHPERVAGIFFRSGSAYGAWTRGEIPTPELSPAVFQVPLLFNGGAKETEGIHGAARVADRAMLRYWREQGAPAGFALDPNTGHECGDSRYFAIAYLDAIMTMRLPDKGGDLTKLKPVDWSQGYMGIPFESTVVPEAEFKGDKKAAFWLPNAAIAKLWAEYAKTGVTEDSTPPPVPANVRVSLVDGTKDNEITWEAEADFESGLRQFIILRDGVEIGRVPEKPGGKSVRPLFQPLNGGDTPQMPLPQMRFVEKDAPVNIKAPVYTVRSVNGAGLESK